MDSRTLIAVALMLLIYMFFLQPAPTPPPIATNAVSPAAITQSVKAEEIKAAAPDTSIDKVRKSTITLSSDLMTVSLNGLGEILKVTLKKYGTDLKESSPIEFDFGKAPYGAEDYLGLSSPLNWTSRATSDSLSVIGENSELRVEKTLLLEPGTYALKVTEKIINKSGTTKSLKSQIRIYHPKESEVEPAGFWTALFKPHAEIQSSVALIEGSLKTEVLSHINAESVYDANISFGGFSRKYFFFGMIPQDISISKMTTRREESYGVVKEIALNEKQIPGKESSSLTYSLYFGPKDIPELTKVNPDLAKVVDYGDWLGPIARLLLGILHFFHNIIANYGVGIILLTLLVKVCLFPLAFKAAVSMRKLQLVAPKMKELRDKYKDDKYRLNAEVMALYKTEKVNPVGGCLPILLQMPIFFALYRVFFVSIELRHAPFFGWIHDLASHDPYLVTPILMTALMWLQQQITPTPQTAGDNEIAQMQMKMMKIMPVMFGGIMLFLPAGLNLYMLTNALISVLQQVWLNKHLNLKFPLPNASPSKASA